MGGHPAWPRSALQCYSWRTNELDIVNTDWVIYSRICMALEKCRDNGRWPAPSAASRRSRTRSSLVSTCPRLDLRAAATYATRRRQITGQARAGTLVRYKHIFAPK